WVFAFLFPFPFPFLFLWGLLILMCSLGYQKRFQEVLWVEGWLIQPSFSWEMVIFLVCGVSLPGAPRPRLGDVSSFSSCANPQHQNQLSPLVLLGERASTKMPFSAQRRMGSLVVIVSPWKRFCPS